MGKALEWIGEDGCDRVAMELLTETRVHGGEIWAHCPFHQEGSAGNAFSYSPAKDAAYCNSCGAKGDLIKIFGAVHGLDDKAAFVEFRNRYAPDVKPERKNRLATPMLKRRRETVAAAEPREVRAPAELWQEKAAKLVEYAHETLMKTPDQLKWLADRGISRKTASRFRLGWLPKNEFRARESWGLPTELKENGRPKKMIIPGGLIIPCMDGEKILRVRVRRIDGTPKYYVLPGSSNDPAPMLLAGSGWKGQHQAAVVTEAELDAILVSQECGDLVHVIAAGSATALPKDSRAMELARSAAWVGLWLDRDPAGDKGVAAWCAGYPSARDIRADLGQGKKSDPGDCHAAGLSVRDHVVKHLPRSWQVGLRLRASASGRSSQGSGVKSSDNTGGGDRVGHVVSESVKRFGRLLEYAKVVVCRYADDGVSIKAVKRQNGQWVEDVQWIFEHEVIADDLWRMFWHDDEVEAYLENHPNRETGVNYKNFWKGVQG